MEHTPNSSNKLSGDKHSIDLTIKLLLIVILLAWCVMIILPFLIPILWGIILAITLFPVYKKLLTLLKGKKGLASTLLTGLLLVLLIVPSVWLISALVKSAVELITALRDQTLVIPPPNPAIADWPLVGKPIYAAWKSLTTNLESAIVQYRDQIILVGEKLLGAVKSVAANFIMMILSIVISGIMLANTEKSEKSSVDFASRLMGTGGHEFVAMVVLTIRNVAKGILGVALIQSILMGAAFMLANIPFAGIWAVLVLLFAIIQLPVGIIAIPVIIYLYSAREPLPATLWSVLILLLGLIDNVLKPWLMGKGAPVPMLVIFIGAIGGMIMSGFIGLFTGAIILSLGYKLALIWLQDIKHENQAPAK
jgi:predicted PurR-regulated permease PerM